MKARVCQHFEVCQHEFANFSLPCEGRLKDQLNNHSIQNLCTTFLQWSFPLIVTRMHFQRHRRPLTRLFHSGTSPPVPPVNKKKSAKSSRFMTMQLELERLKQQNLQLELQLLSQKEKLGEESLLSKQDKTSAADSRGQLNDKS